MKKRIMFCTMALVALGTALNIKAFTEETFVDSPQEDTTHVAPIVWKLGSKLTEREVLEVGPSNFFHVCPIDDTVFARMQKGGSYPDGCVILRSELRYIQLLHYNYAGEIVCGELVCNKAIANDVRDAFIDIFNAHYPIARLELIDNFGADDETSMRANNSSAFCFRSVKGSKVLSLHARGMAIDINTLHNPYVKRDASGRIIKLQPNTPEARKYATRVPKLPHMIVSGDACHKAFVSRGFTWGGNWRSLKDYQHFERKY